MTSKEVRESEKYYEIIIWEINFLEFLKLKKIILKL